MPRQNDQRTRSAPEPIARPRGDDWPWNLDDDLFLDELRRQSALIGQSEAAQPDEILEAFGSISAEP